MEASNAVSNSMKMVVVIIALFIGVKFHRIFFVRLLLRQYVFSDFPATFGICCLLPSLHTLELLTCLWHFSPMAEIVGNNNRDSITESCTIKCLVAF
jgi:hypothetical protein